MRALIYFSFIATVSFQDTGLAESPAPTWHKIAQQASTEKKYQVVVDQLSPHLTELSHDELLLLGKTYQTMNLHSLAVSVFQTATTKYPEDLEFRSHLGEETWEMGNDLEKSVYLTGKPAPNTPFVKKESEGLEILQKLHSENKKYEPVYHILGRIYEAKSLRAELRNLYQDLADLKGNDPETTEKLCEIYTQDAFYDLSEKYCNLGMKLNPKCDSCVVYLGKTKKGTDHEAEAGQLLLQAATNFSKSELAQISYAQYAEEKNNYIAAYQYFTQALSLHPDDKKAMIGAANAGVEVQKFSEALILYKKLCLKDPSTLVQFRNATAKLKQGKNNDWLKKFQTAIETCHSESIQISQ